MQNIGVVANVTVSGVCLYFLSEISRFFGKNVFERLFFKEELKMPTTNFLMYSDKTYSSHHKSRIRKKIFDDLKIEIPLSDEEKKNPEEARKRIVEAMALIRKKLHENSFLLQHNIEYGIMRNFIGGTLIGLPISLLGAFLTYKTSSIAFVIFIGLSITYIIFIIFSKFIIEFYGKSYAKILYREYLGS